MANKTEATLRTLLLKRNSRYCNKSLRPAPQGISRGMVLCFLASYYLVAGADLQFGVQGHENRGRRHADQHEGKAHCDVLRSVPVYFGRHTQNCDSGHKAAQVVCFFLFAVKHNRGDPKPKYGITLN